MKVRPILFSGSMVRALLDGSKAQTRRPVKPQPPAYIDSDMPGLRSLKQRPCPHGQPGDLLYVRETWSAYGAFAAYGTGRVSYRADEDQQPQGLPWKPSIHMPRWASRLTLRITDVRVERLNEISEADAEAEGAEPILVPPDGGSDPHAQGFCELWNSINGPEAWDKNPWVWVVCFEVIHANVDQVIERTAA